MKESCGSCHSIRPATKGLAFVCTLAATVLAGCASSQQSIDATAGKFRPHEIEARQAMLAGRHAFAHILYTEASEQVDSNDDTYVDGLFYLDHARMEGNRAFMALLDGKVEEAQDHFKSSERYLNSGIRAHKAILEDREDTQQGAAAVLGLGAVLGLAVVGADAASGAQTSGQSNAIQDATMQLLELSIDAFDLISRAIVEIHEIDVHEDAQHVDPDAWRAAAISDHPLARAVVRVFSRSMAGTSSCTGFFIQPRLVATSAHCLDESDPSRVWVEVHDPRQKERFLLGKPVRRLATERVYWPSTYDWGKRSCDPVDVALIVVGEDDASDDWLPIDTKPVVGQSEALIIGYSGDLDRGFFQRIDYGCELEQDNKTKQIGHNCVSYGGNSGGPVMAVDYSQAKHPFRVVGVHSCGIRAKRAIRVARKTRWAAGMLPLAELYRGVIARNSSLGDSRLFEVGADEYPTKDQAETTPKKTPSAATLRPKCAELPGQYLDEKHAECWEQTDNRPGCYLWRTHYHSDQTTKWSGRCHEGVATGRGVYSVSAGSEHPSYEGKGTLVGGKASGGHWIVEWANGNRYEGDFRDGKRHGRGTYTWADGARYEGDYHNGKPHGQGTLTFATGNRYEGRWRKGCFDVGDRRAQAHTTRETCGWE